MDAPKCVLWMRRRLGEKSDIVLRTGTGFAEIATKIRGSYINARPVLKGHVSASEQFLIMRLTYYCRDRLRRDLIERDTA